MSLLIIFSTFLQYILIVFLVNNILLPIIPVSLRKPFQSIAFKFRKVIKEAVNSFFDVETFEVKIISIVLIPFLAMALTSQGILILLSVFNKYIGITIFLYIILTFSLLNAVPSFEEWEELSNPDSLSVVFLLFKLVVLLEYHFLSSIPFEIILSCVVFPFSLLFEKIGLKQLKPVPLET